LTIRNPWPKTKAQREKNSDCQEETMNAEQRRAGTANKTKPQRQRAGRGEGDLTRGTAKNRAPHTADPREDSLEMLARQQGENTGGEEGSAIPTERLFTSVLVLKFFF
jgi:hypothetical protein